MDPTTFGALQQEIKKKSFSSDKQSVLQKYSQHFFSAQQCVGVLNDFSHASDKVEAMAIIAPRLVTLNGEDGKLIVKAFTFADDQVQAVRLIASHVYDPSNKYAILDAITFTNDKEQAKDILDNTSATPPIAACGGNYSVCFSQQAAGAPCIPPPQQQQAPYQPPNPGGYPPPPTQGAAYPPPPTAGYSQPYPSQQSPSGEVNFQFGVGGGSPIPRQQAPPPGKVNMQFGLGSLFGLPTGNISFQTNPSQPPPWL